MDFASHASALFVASGATVLLNTSIFSHNVISDAYPNSAVISANAVNPQFNNGQQQDTILRLQNCTIAKGNSNSTLQLAAFTGIPYSNFDVSVFSDVDREVLRYADSESTSGTTLSLVKSPASRPGIDASSPWFVNLKVRRTFVTIIALICFMPWKHILLSSLFRHFAWKYETIVDWGGLFE